MGNVAKQIKLLPTGPYIPYHPVSVGFLAAPLAVQLPDDVAEAAADGPS